MGLGGNLTISGMARPYMQRQRLRSLAKHIGSTTVVYPKIDHGGLFSAFFSQPGFVVLGVLWLCFFLWLLIFFVAFAAFVALLVPCFTYLPIYLSIYPSRNPKPTLNEL